MKLKYRELINSINQLHQQITENEVLNRMQVLNYFSMPYALLHNATPLMPTDNGGQLKGKFEIENNSSILKIFIDEKVRLVILPDTKTHFDYDDCTLLLAVDVENRKINCYLPRVNNYDKAWVIDCSNVNDAVDNLKKLDITLNNLNAINNEKISNQDFKKMMIMQLQAESQASQNYSCSSSKRDFCKILIKEMNDLIRNQDTRFIDFLAQTITEDVNLSDNHKQKIKTIISKALENQDNDLEYRFLALSENVFRQEVEKLPRYYSPALLPKDNRVISYIDVNRQIESNHEENNDYEESKKTIIEANEKDNFNHDSKPKDVTPPVKEKEKTAGDIFLGGISGGIPDDNITISNEGDDENDEFNIFNQ